MNRREFVVDWYNSFMDPGKHYTLKEARADMENLRIDAAATGEKLPGGLTVRYLYETINELIDDYNKGEN